MAADTLNEDYAIILRSRAIAAREKKNYAEAYYYQTRNADLSKILSDSLIKGKAHDYAARYHAQEQQLEIQEKQAEAKRSHIISLAVAAIALLAVAIIMMCSCGGNAPGSKSSKSSSDSTLCQFSNIKYEKMFSYCDDDGDTLYFDNSFKSMVSFFANNQDITLEELDDIRRMIDAVPQDDAPAKTEQL